MLWSSARQARTFRIKVWLLISLLAVVPFVSIGVAQEALPVVPGGSGFGMATRAAYGSSVPPVIVSVTNLNDSGPGSLRAALAVAAPRVVVFEISGTIALSSMLSITSPYVTVAGQTAPSPGITLKNYGVEVSTHDALLQHFRVRPGGNTCNNGIELWGANSYRVVLDHMSISWGQDENVVLYNSSRAIDTTIWRSIISEGLHYEVGLVCGGGSSESHGLLVYDNTKNVSVAESIFAHNVERNPYPKGNTSSYFVNNLIYNWGADQAAIFADPDGTGPVLSSLVGNVFRRGPSTPTNAWMAQSRYLKPGSQVYVAQNYIDGESVGTFSVINNEGINPLVGSSPVGGLSPRLQASQVQSSLLAGAGARPADRDAVDVRIVSEVQDRTGGVIASQTQVGSWPTLQVTARTLTPPSDPHRIGASGYTVLEEWLHAYARSVEGGDASAAPAPPTGLKIVF